MMNSSPHQQNAVAQAALAMVRPATDSAARSAASQFLEQWTRTPEAWDVYATWLASFSTLETSLQLSAEERAGTQLLCLTLLQSKIRREVPRGTPEFPALIRVRQELWSLLLSVSAQPAVSGRNIALGPLCVCTAALAARCGNISELVMTCCLNSGSPSLSPQVCLKLLASVPSELEACSDLTTPQSELWSSMERVLEYVRQCLVSSDTAIPALGALREWSQTCHVSLSHLNSNSIGGEEALLPLLIRILSSPSCTNEQLLIMASRALTEVILVPSDSCTPSRQAAVSQMLSAVQEMGFVVNPLKDATYQDWDDACHALSTLICTLVTEDVDDICTLPAEPILALLLHLQSHARIPVALPVLECWLTVQDIPTSERHANWTQPLFRQVVQGLIVRVAYPVDGEVEDETEFAELRRMVTDVLISSYFLLRTEYLQHMVGLVVSSNQPWNAIEAVLFGLHQVSREVCARIKARAGGESVRVDKNATAQQLLQLVQHLIQQSEAHRQHPLVQKAIANFLGSYAPAWNTHCAPEAILQLIAYLHRQHGSTSTYDDETARAVRAIYIACSSKLLEIPQPLLAKSVQDTMETVLMTVTSGTTTAEAVSAVTEGSTRLLMHLQAETLTRQTLGDILSAIIPRADQALHTVNGSNVAESQAGFEALLKYLRALCVIIQFCDGPPEDSNEAGGSTNVHPLSDVVGTTLWPFLERVSQQAGSYDMILQEVLSIHRQLLNNARILVEARFFETVKMVVQALEQTTHPGTLDYIASAVEVFSGKEEASFQGLLSHVTIVICTYVTTDRRPDECPQLVRAFFELVQRYVVFQPTALVGCPDFGTIVAFAVECLTACKGERESTRATLNFLAQLFGWRSLRLSESSGKALKSAAGRIDELLLEHGRVVTRACVAGLAGGSPQMLWPSLSDCLFAIVTHIAGADPVEEETTVAHQWVYEALSSSCVKDSRVNPETGQQIMSILFGLARQGPKSKPKAKMLLTDFAKICKGDMYTDALLTYTLQ